MWFLRGANDDAKVHDQVDELLGDVIVAELRSERYEREMWGLQEALKLLGARATDVQQPRATGPPVVDPTATRAKLTVVVVVMLVVVLLAIAVVVVVVIAFRTIGRPRRTFRSSLHDGPASQSKRLRPSAPPRSTLTMDPDALPDVRPALARDLDGSISTVSSGPISMTCSELDLGQLARELGSEEGF